MFHRGNSGDGCDLTSTLCKSDLRKGDLFVLSWVELVQRVRCVCVWLGAAWMERGGGECMRGLGLGFTNPVGTGEVLDVCLCFGCGGGECVGGLYQGLEGWGDVMSL